MEFRIIHSKQVKHRVTHTPACTPTHTPDTYTPTLESKMRDRSRPHTHTVIWPGSRKVQRLAEGVCVWRLQTGCRHFAPQQILQQPCAGLWLIPPAFYWCWRRQVTRKRTEKQLPNKRLQRGTIRAWRRDIPSFSLRHSPFFDVSGTNSDPARRCLLLLLLLMLPGQFVSSSSSETSHLSHSPSGEEGPRRDRRTRPQRRCDGPADCLVTVQAEERSGVPLRVQRVWWMSLGFLEGWRVDVPAAFRDSSETRVN